MKGLSICIPIYNYNCIDSVRTLCEQIRHLSVNCEILLIDDASTISLDELANFQHQFYTYEKLAKNIGRSKIRNLLVKKSKFNHVLFIDGDSGVPEKFIENYMLHIENHPEAIICGGRIHQKKLSKTKRLRYNYGVKYEDTKSSQRIKKPYHRFMTNNFVVPKEIMKTIPFNEELLNYGQEDTFFGYELRKNQVEIIHIDNEVAHLNLETNQEFIEKSKHSIENLIYLKTKYPEFVEYSKLLSTITKFRIFRLSFIKNYSYSFSKFFEFITRHSGNIYSFQMFKLFYTISLIK
ncbi:glycosyltransferase family 2 protein [Geojedonia litorea]|uniref:Glycosyltransferase family 2 protein n=1 Tax=Geojedonia litorea TaxID=1268269 RepID=A0ABV9N4M8_9FLAO